MRQGIYLVVIAGVISALTLLLLAGAGPWAGPELFGISENHGVHLGDLPVFALWVIGVACCVQAWRER